VGVLVGVGVGPTIGGVIVDNASWRWIFAPDIPMGILVAVLGVIVIPQSSRAATKAKVDIAGGVLLAAGVISFLYGMTAWANHPEGLGSPGIWGFFVAAAALLAWLLRLEGRVPAPMVETRLLFSRDFFVLNLYSFLYGALSFGLFAFTTYYATIAYGLGETTIGLALIPRFVAVTVCSFGCSFLIPRIGYRLPLLFGAAVLSGSILLLSMGHLDYGIIGIDVTAFGSLVLVMTLAGVGNGVANPASGNAGLDIYPDELAAVTGLRGMFRIIGGVAGTSVIVVALSRFDDKVRGMESIFFVMGLLVAAMLPLTAFVPEERRRREARARERG
jgi:MFS family permease